MEKSYFVDTNCTVRDTNYTNCHEFRKPSGSISRIRAIGGSEFVSINEICVLSWSKFVKFVS